MAPWGNFWLRCRSNRHYINAGHDGNGCMYSTCDRDAGPDGLEDPYRACEWILHFQWDNVPYVKLQNGLHGEQWLHCGHDGTGLYCENDDGHDVYFWELNNVSKKFFYLRNKAYPELFLYLDGDQPTMGELGEDCPEHFQWKLEPTDGKAPFKGPSDDFVYSLENIESGKSMNTGHDGNGEFYCNCEYGEGGEGPYHWAFDRSRGGLATFRSEWMGTKVFNVGHDGDGKMYHSECADDSGAYEFYMIPVGDGAFMIRNKLHPHQYLAVEGTEFCTAMLEDGCCSSEEPLHMMWRIIRRECDCDSDDEW